MSSLNETLELLGFQSGERFALAAIKDRKIVPEVFDDVRRAEAWLTIHEDWNTYLTLNPVCPGVTGRPRAADISRAPWLLVDLDPEGDEDVQSYATFVHEKYGGIHVFSGRGHQIWLNVGDGADRAGILRAIRQEVTECKVDAVHDPGRLCRLPGSINSKTGQRARVLATAPSRPPEPLSRPPCTAPAVQRASDEEIAAMLEILSPDLCYNDWLRVGMALHHAGQPVEVWETWSRQGAKYQEGDCERWYGFGDTDEPVTVGTLRHLAVEAGWDPADYLLEHRDDDGVWSWLESTTLLGAVCKKVGVTKGEAKAAAKRARVAEKMANMDAIEQEFRYTVEDAAYWHRFPTHGWHQIKVTDLNTLLGEGAPQIRAELMANAWTTVGEPFEPEDLAGRRWNRTGAQLIEAHPGDFPTIRAAIERLQGPLDYEDYLFLWAGFLVQRPKGKLPALFLYSAENETGKSSFASIMKSLFLKGAVDVAGVLRGDDGSRFTAELEGAVFCYFDEEKCTRGGMDKLKKLITEPDLLSEGKGKDRRVVPNYTHFVITSNHPDTVAFDHNDKRVLMWEVPPLDSPMEKSEFEARVADEAPAFLHYLLNLKLPQPQGRLQLPVLETDIKAEQAESGMDPVQIYVMRHPEWIVTPLGQIAKVVNLDPATVERSLPVGKRRAWRVLSKCKEKNVFGTAKEIISKLSLDVSPITVGKYFGQAERLGLAERTGNPAEWRLR